MHIIILILSAHHEDDDDDRPNFHPLDIILQRSEIKTGVFVSILIKMPLIFASLMNSGWMMVNGCTGERKSSESIRSSSS